MVIGALRHQDELFAEPFGVLTGEFTRRRVEVPQSLDSDEKGLLVIKTGCLTVGDLPAEVASSSSTSARECPVPLDVSAPPVDLGLQLRVRRHHARPSATAGPGAVCHT